MKKKIFDYFEDRIEFPKNILDDILPVNILWEYMSATFLNGLINYCKPLAVYQLDRYASEKENCAVATIENIKFQVNKYQLRDLVVNEEVNFRHTDLSMFHDDIIILAEIESKEPIYKINICDPFFDAFNKPNKNGKIYDPDALKEAFQKYIQTTDTLELQVPDTFKKKNIKKYIFFWFDYDVSDCCVGRFETNDDVEDIKQSIVNFLLEEEQGKRKETIEFGDYGVVSHTELPLSWLKGWLKY
jgi:hypothetical protein